MVRRPFSTSYVVCRDDFRRATADAAHAESHAIAARGPGGEELTIDVAVLGSPKPAHALVVLAGVHGVEGFTASPIVCDAAARWTGSDLAPGVGVVLVHAVNPWGMAWQRRQNESNVDLNRNWGADAPDRTVENPGYELLHPTLCPTGPAPPDAESFLAAVRPLVDRHGETWVHRAVSSGQISHPHGLYFAGTELEASTRILRAVVADVLAETRSVSVVDLHTGFGDHGALTLLARCQAGTAADRWTRDTFEGFEVRNTVTPDRPPRAGQLATGLAEAAPDAEWHAVTAELGTRGDLTMILAERAEHWVHRHGDRTDPEHASIVEHHLRCSTPADEAWQRSALEHGRRVLDRAIDRVAATASGGSAIPP